MSPFTSRLTEKQRVALELIVKAGGAMKGRDLDRALRVALDVRSSQVTGGKAVTGSLISHHLVTMKVDDLEATYTVTPRGRELLARYQRAAF